MSAVSNDPPMPSVQVTPLKILAVGERPALTIGLAALTLIKSPVPEQTIGNRRGSNDRDLHSSAVARDLSIERCAKLAVCVVAARGDDGRQRNGLELTGQDRTNLVRLPPLPELGKTVSRLSSHQSRENPGAHSSRAQALVVFPGALIMHLIEAAPVHDNFGLS